MKRQNMINTALNMYHNNFLHSNVVRAYNSIKPLPSGYRLKDTDAWCAAFASVVAWTASGGSSDFPYECSCARMIEKAKKMKIWIEDESMIPAPGWLCLYDWQDDGSGDCEGFPDHVGIITKVNDKTFEVIEGNYSNAIGRRLMKFNGRFIRGFIAPRYEQETETRKTDEEIAREVIKGLWSTGATRKRKLEEAGYEYKAIQKIVNNLMK